MEKEIREKRKDMICELVEDPKYVPMKEKEMAVFLQVAAEEREEFRSILRQLEEEGRLMITRGGKYQKPDGGILTGKFIGNSRGFGFVETTAGGEDLFIPEEETNGAFHGDTVLVRLLPQGAGKRREARVVKILARGIKQVVGSYECRKENYGFVIPDNPKIPSDIFIPGGCSGGAVNGHKVVAEITDYGTDRRSPEGRITEILGHLTDPGVDILAIARGYEMPIEFSEKAENQAERVAKAVSQADRVGRRDLRDVVMVTIDGEDAKDLDDAVSLSFDGAYYHLGVHIADVTNYVQENSALDREALNRGTSVYLADRVIPMLPRVLSNGICSLNEGEERLALSCLMTVDVGGEIVDHEICESVIKVRKRLTYTVVKELLERDEAAGSEEERGAYEELLPMLRGMAELAAVLREKRRKRGSIDFDFPECKIVLDGEGHPLEILPYERNVATDLIEDFMLAANETVAQHFYWMEAPFLYRVHDVPDGERIRKLSALIRGFGYSMKAVGRAGAKISGEEVHPKEIQKLLAKIAGQPEEAMISRLALRSMRQAKYSVECTGHFGLACACYCHFTSPIRRYPDLQIHRIIKDQLRGRLGEERAEHYRGILPEVAKQSSETERRASEAERETEKLKKAEYMEAYIGECFEGVISGVTGWGIYVELPNTVEGLIPVNRMTDDFYLYDEEKCELRGENTGRVYRLGMRAGVRVVNCERVSRTVYFELADSRTEVGEET
ncbi:MAG: ribonuclease R [Roseburia sp.]|nr:ribonuclease R [Roseburia sp.]MCM1099688.1 ribonuclease R [Ruminococcus flavefaciens]